jgi:hypothetical protein
MTNIIPFFSDIFVRKPNLKFKNINAYLLVILISQIDDRTPNDDDKLLSISKTKKGDWFLNNSLTEIATGLQFSSFDRGEHSASFYI